MSYPDSKPDNYLDMARQESKSTRIDLRVPNELLEEIQQIALTRFNAPIHHISGKPEMTPTIIQLIQYGIKYLNSYPDINPDSIPLNPDNLPDTFLDKLSDKLSGKLSDKIPDTISINPDYLPDSFLDKLSDKVKEKLSGNIPDKLPDNIVTEEKLNEAIADLKLNFSPRLDKLESKISLLENIKKELEELELGIEEEELTAVLSERDELVKK